MERDARAIAETAARESYGRLLAWLAARTGDVAAAEDALADAFQAALVHWPKTGAPENPDGWLLTAAKRKLIDGARRARTRSDNTPALVLAIEEAEAAALRDPETFPDERLKLLFICAHPAIDKSVRTPLMLQTVLGLDAARIASAFLVSPNAMSGRLVRAKRKIKEARIPFEEPDPQDLAERMQAVLEAIYAAYGAGWLDESASGGAYDDLAAEAGYLARLTTTLLPDEPEAFGLAALILYTESRRAARMADDRYIPLEEQDTALWDRNAIAAAEASLAKAWMRQRPGRFQIEAAIQSAHTVAQLHGRDTRRDVVTLYDQLMGLAPTIGAAVSRAAALARADRTEEALTSLSEIDPKRVARYQPFWAVRAHIRALKGDRNGAASDYETAIGLTEDESTRRFLAARKDNLI